MAARKPHKVAHDPCPHGATSWTACDQAGREAMGRCRAMTESENECTNWAIDEYDGKGYCGQHYSSRVNAGIVAERASVRKAELDERIERFIAWSQDHPSVWDQMPKEWSPVEESNPVTILTTGGQVPRARGGVIWSARSGQPAPPAKHG